MAYEHVGLGELLHMVSTAKPHTHGENTIDIAQYQDHINIDNIKSGFTSLSHADA